MRLPTPHQTNFWLPLSVMALVGLVGAVTVFQSHASTSVSSVQVETGSLSTPLTSIADTTASGGRVVKFGGVANIGQRGFGMSVPRLPSQTVAVQDQWLSDMQSMGISWIRIDIDWWGVQPNNAQTYNWARYDTAVTEATKYGIKVDGIIDYSTPWAIASSCNGNTLCPPANLQTYVTYAKAVVTHFGSKLGAVEIWNEPNLAMFWYPQSDPATYTQMLKLSYAGIKSVNPHMLVISGGLAPAGTVDGNTAPLEFASTMYANGAKGSFDAFGFHPYSYPAVPSLFEQWSGWSQMAETNPSIRSIMSSNGDAATPLWMTEVGAPTGGPGSVSSCADPNLNAGAHFDECRQAQEYSEIISRNNQYSWAGVAFFYSYKDDGTTPDTNENFFGVIRADGTQKAAYSTIKQAVGP